MPLPIQNARASTALHREFNLVGRYRPQLDEVVVPVVMVADVQGVAAPPEIRRAYGRGTQGAVALERTIFRLEVPPGLVCLVTVIRVNASGSYILGLGQAQAAAPPTTADESFLDNRLILTGQAPAAALTFGTQVAPIAGPKKRLVSSSTVIGPSWHPNVVVAGVNGSFGFFEVQQNSVNIAVEMEWEWTEYLPTS